MTFYNAINHRLIFSKLIPFVSFIIFLNFSSCNKSPEDGGPLFSILDSNITGINFLNYLPEYDPKFNIIDYLYYYNGAGVAAGDINNDGLTDLFFVSNQGKNKLYLNKGNWKFEDISEKAGVTGFANWKTGVSMADINGDGYLDIYVCAVGNYKGLEGSNELYINNGNATFTEQAADYGLDFTGFSTQAAFFDYDKDGDLDCYLLNHAVHTSRSYDRVIARNLKNNEAGDYLFENRIINKDGKSEKKFKDVSSSAGIYQAAMGYGLGINIADYNNDGWSDIYVSNDFHEDDYYYLNNKNGTFTESLKKSFGHTSRFSMGCDAADINNDGYQDIITLDMNSEEEEIEKSSMGEDPFDIFLYKLGYGFFYQYSRNCLQLNQSGKKFIDIASMSGLASTDWSWSPLMADFNNDGYKDIFITNGIVHRPNNLDYTRYASDDSLRYALETSKSLDEKAIKMMPGGKVHNYIFKGNPSLIFEDKSNSWGFKDKNISNGAVYADLDNDGDLDLITNNINEAALVYQNLSISKDKVKDGPANNYLKVKFTGEKANLFGIGAKVFLINKGKMQTQQMFPVRGFMSSVEPTLNFGLANLKFTDSLIVIWESGKAQVLTHIKSNQLINLKEKDAGLSGEKILSSLFKKEEIFKNISGDINISRDSLFVHKENPYYDFHRESLMPFRVSTEGPKVAIGDVNGDGLDDIYVCGAKWQPGKLFIQQNENNFTASNHDLFRADSTFEDVDALFFDADNDKDLDLYVVSGGNEFYGNMVEQFDRLYINDGKGNFARGKNNLPPMFDNKSCVRPCDFDKDGDIDLFVGGRVLAYNYGKMPNSYLLVNDGIGNFKNQISTIAPALENAGMITDASWSDYDKDGDQDLIVAGDWMPVKYFENKNKKFYNAEIAFVNENNSPALMNGFWQTIVKFDFDKDGDDDFVVGNIGTNTKLRKSGPNSVLKMFVIDIDKNNNLDQIIVYNRGKEFYTLGGKDELGKQLPSVINKRFTDYKSFAGKTVDEIFNRNELKGADELIVDKFESVYLENKGNKKFVVHDLPFEAQASKIFTLFIDDVNKDGNLDIFSAGNFYGVNPYQGRYDSNYGLILKGNGRGGFQSILPTDSGFMLEGEIRDIKKLKTREGELIVVAGNNRALQFFKKK